jgi:hypothetical protein
MTRPHSLPHSVSGEAALALAFAFVLAIAPVRADDQPQATQPKVERPRGGRIGQADDPTAHIPELRDETFRLMDAYLISNLQESLGLSDEQFGRALPLVKKLQSDRRASCGRR